MDYTAYTDDELDQARVDVANETERRARLASAPDQVATIAARYAEDGGELADLTAAIDTVTTPDDDTDGT